MSQLFDSRLTRYGIPFFLFIVGGSFGLREFVQLRYKYRKTSQHTREELANQGIPIKDSKEITLEKEYEKLKEKNLGQWENKRIQRPWDET